MGYLDYLKKLGVLPDTLKEIDFKNNDVVALSDFLKDVDQLIGNSVVIADNAEFVATPFGVSLGQASEIYSGGNGTVCCWSDKHELAIQKLENGLLVTKKRITQKKQKEELKMSDFGNLENMSMDALGMDALSAFGDGAAPSAPVMNDGGVAAADNASNLKFWGYTQKYGRFMCFITRHEANIKVSKKKVKLIGADGKPILKASMDIPEDVRQKYNENKQVSATYLECEDQIVFKEMRPQVAGGVLRIPKGALVSTDFITDILGQKEVNFSDTNQDTKLVVLSTDRMINTILTMFHGRIKEDEAVAGATAGQIVTTMKKSKSKSKDADNVDVQEVYKPTLSAIRRGKEYKNPVTEGNYIPLSVYEKAGQQNLTDEEALELNLNIEAVIKDKSTYDMLSASSKEVIHWDQDATACHVTSDFFRTGAPCKPIEIPRYFDKDVLCTDVMLPLRDREIGKEQKVTYKFRAHKITDEKGPLSKPEYRDLVTGKLGMSVEDFQIAVQPLTKARKKRSNDNTISVDEYLSAMTSGGIGNVAVESFDTTDLVKVLSDIA